MTNNVEIDNRGLIYIVDRNGAGMDILQLFGCAAAIVTPVRSCPPSNNGANGEEGRTSAGAAGLLELNPEAPLPAQWAGSTRNASSRSLLSASPGVTRIADTPVRTLRRELVAANGPVHASQLHSCDNSPLGDPARVQQERNK